MMWAAREGKPGLVRLLLRNRANVNAKRRAKHTALYYAAKQRRKEIVGILKEAGGDVSFEELTKKETTSDSNPTSDWTAILYNCNCHNFEEVERQIIKALSCSVFRARAISWEVHSRGRSTILEGSRERCEAVASVLGKAGLDVKSQPISSS